MSKIGIIGGGNMGSAILAGIYKKHSVSVCEADLARASALKKQFKVKIVDLATLIKSSSIIVLAVKPQQFEEVLSQIRSQITSKHLIISIAAGITTVYIEKSLGKNVRVVRTMPNLPAQVKMGMTGIAKGKNATSADVKTTQSIFNSIGKTVIVNEDLLDAITAVSGSGPAYVFLFVECLQKSAKELGLNDKDSKALIIQTLRGSLDLLENSKEEANILRERVTSKGGTTQAALDVLRDKYNLEKIFSEALSAAKSRAKELSK